MSRYTLKKQYAWTHEIAYFVGLISADGCLVNNGRHINITSKDFEILAYCQTILNKATKTRTKIGQFNTLAYCWQFSDVALYEFLITAGLTPAKSKTIGMLNIPVQYWGDFIRGYFDGDGTTYGYIDKRWKNSRMYYVGFISASMNFLQWLSTQNQLLIGTIGSSIRVGTRANTLVYAKEDSRKLYEFMYGDSTSASKFSLLRKRTKLYNFINGS